MSRDNARTPVQWDGSPHAGFTTGEPWIEVNANHRRDQRGGPGRRPRRRCSRTTAGSSTLRHTEPAVALGDFTMLLPHHEQVYAFTRTLGGTSLLVLVNVSGETADVDLPDADRWAGAELVLAHLDGDPAPDAPLRPWEARVHRLVALTPRGPPATPRTRAGRALVRGARRRQRRRRGAGGGAGPDHEVGGEHRVARLAGGPAGAELPQQQGGGARALPLRELAHGRQAEHLAQLVPVDAHHGDVVGHPQAEVACGQDAPTAISSEAAKIAVGRSGAARSRLARA